MMLRDCLISGFADEINRDFGVQLKTLQELGQKYIELRAADGIGVEVIDLRSLYPLDKELIGESIAKTHKAIVITEEVKRGGFGGEISAIIGEEFFDYLDAPVIRIGALDTPVPFAPNLEQYYIPNAQDILVAAKKMF